MKKTILITGATDGIGLETTKVLHSQGHNVLIHGRSAEKIEKVQEILGDDVESYLADLSHLDEVRSMADAVKAKHQHLDILINNAGILKTPNPITRDNLDIRFVVNTLAPYLLTKELMPLFDGDSRIVNLSSAARAPVNLDALRGKITIGEDYDAYAQSKLAITTWTRTLADEVGPTGPMIVAVNPGSLLATKMVKEGFGMAGNDINIGSDILVRAALSDEFADASGKYYDNDAKQFAPLHQDSMDNAKTKALIGVIEELVAT